MELKIYTAVSVCLVCTGVFSGGAIADTGKSGSGYNFNNEQRLHHVGDFEPETSRSRFVRRVSDLNENDIHENYREGFRRRKIRIAPYRGPSLDLHQIHIGTRKHPELKAHDFKQLTRTGSSYIFSKQVLVRRKMLESPYYNLKLREKDPICTKPYSNKTEAEYAAVLNGLPLVVWLNENNKKAGEFDPNTLFPKRMEEDNDVRDYGIVIESEPEDLDIGVSVQFY